MKAAKANISKRCLDHISIAGVHVWPQVVLPESDQASEYLYDKSIKNLSVSVIQQSGRIILYFLGFFEGSGSTIYTRTGQAISAFVEYQQGHD